MFCHTCLGMKQLFDATRRNSSVLYVTQRQQGAMIEGHRELIDGYFEFFYFSFRILYLLLFFSSKKPDKGTPDLINQSQFTKLIGPAKFALRIDIRNNNASNENLLNILDTLEIIGS